AQERLRLLDVGGSADDVEVDPAEELLVGRRPGGPDLGLVPRLLDQLVDERQPRHRPGRRLLRPRPRAPQDDRPQPPQRPRAGPPNRPETVPVHRPAPGFATTPHPAQALDAALDAWSFSMVKFTQALVRRSKRIRGRRVA